MIDARGCRRYRPYTVTLLVCLLAGAALQPSDSARAAGVAAAGGTTPAPMPATGTESGASHPFPAMEGIFTEYRDLHVGASYDAAGREFRVGHLRVNFRAGTLTAILTRSGSETGFIYDGSEGHYLSNAAAAASGGGQAADAGGGAGGGACFLKPVRSMLPHWRFRRRKSQNAFTLKSESTCRNPKFSRIPYRSSLSRSSQDG